MKILKWFGAALLSTLLITAGYAAETTGGNDDAGNAAEEAQGSADASVEENVAEAKAEKAPEDTLGGAGLKDKKLSVMFEQFVPSETISADNAVPFPIDI